MIILGIDTTTVNWYMWLYILLSLVGLVFGTQKIYSTGPVRGTIFAIGGLLVFVYFGFRWFNDKSSPSTNWPPIINMCPDYLTYVSSLPGCVDLLGVTTKSGGIQKILPSEMGSLNKNNNQKVFQYTSADIQAAKTAADLQPICDRCASAGLTWEGVYDGDTCVGINKAETNAAAAEKCLLSV